MSKKVFNVFSILCFALVLCFIGCTELINPKTETDINLNIDLSKISVSWIKEVLNPRIPLLFLDTDKIPALETFKNEQVFKITNVF